MQESVTPVKILWKKTFCTLDLLQVSSQLTDKLLLKNSFLISVYDSVHMLSIIL